MTVLLAITIVVVDVVAFIILIGAMHAFVAKQITGKWPHQSAEAKRVYDALNNAMKGEQP